MKKLLALILAICCALPLFACGGPSHGSGNNGNSSSFQATYNKDNGNQTVVNFTFYGGGMYGEWADKLCDEFARIHQETYFGGGTKKGVYIKISNPFPVTYTNLNSSDQHIITYNSNTTNPGELKSSGESLYNLDDIVKDETREGGSIESNLFSSVKTSLQNNGSYYGLPYLEYYCGFSYNRGLFNEVGALFADASDTDAIQYESKYSENTYYMTNNDGILAKGPDGKSGTEDDGLPASLEELLVLMQFLKEETEKSKLYPIIVSKDCANYTDGIARALWNSLAGKEQMQNFYNSKGEVEIVERDTNGDIIFTNENIFPGIDYIKKPKTKIVTLNDENGYLGADMAARFYAFAFVEIMQKETGFLAADTGSNTDVQLALMAGSSVRGYKDAAMLIDYSYCYNEVVNSGNLLRLPSGKTEADYDIRYMASPTSFYTEEEQEETEVAIESGSDYYMVVNGNITKDAGVEEAVKELVKYFYSQANLQFVTKNSGFPVALEYGLDDMDKTGMSPYFAKILEVRKSDGSNVVVRGGDSQGYLKNKANLSTRIYVKSTSYSNVYAGIKAQLTEKFFNATQFKSTAWIK